MGRAGGFNNKYCRGFIHMPEVEHKHVNITRKGGRVGIYTNRVRNITRITTHHLLKLIHTQLHATC